MKKTIILELDSYQADSVFNWLSKDHNHEKYNIFILTKFRKNVILKEKLYSFSNIKCITYKDIFEYESKEQLDINLYYDFINQYTNNHITARLFDRAKYFPKYGIGNQNAFCHYTFVAFNTLSFLQDHHIKFICFRNTPHIIEEWLLTQAVKFLHIDFFCFDDYIFPWLFTVRKGHSRDINLVFKDLDFIAKDTLKQHIANCVDLMSKNYEEAIPTYEKERLGNGALKYYNPLSDFKYMMKRPHRFFMKTKNYFYYKRNSKKPDLKQIDYVVFFLHYQPEKTTLPDGFEFVDQFYTIKILSSMLPRHIKLLVKEHPAMFNSVSDPKYRTIHNYKLIQNLPNVELVSLHSDSFELIDNSLALATIKGTATLESYIRKKPVIIFGDNHLKLNGVHNFKTIDLLQKFINDVINNKIVIENVVENLTKICYGRAVSGIFIEPHQVKDYSFSREIRENASYILLSELLKHNLN